ncbi:MAG TPA: hypothetical protein VMO17_03825, partial [Terriglobia bacterium]|nr:hypothetical protein [Terriglobia bacterium]
LPTTRLACRCKKRSMTALRTTFRQKHHTETAMERYTFWLRLRRAVLRASFSVYSVLSVVNPLPELRLCRAALPR